MHGIVKNAFGMIGGRIITWCLPNSSDLNMYAMQL
jgi:hypothetical protein